MTTLAPELLALIHAKLKNYYDYDERLQRAPKQVAFAKQREEKCHENLHEIGEQLQTLRLQIKQKETELASREAQVKKMQGQQDGAANNREYAMLGDTIKATIAANDVLGDEILELLERVDKLVEQQNQATKLLQMAEQETKDTADKTQSTIATLESEMTQLNQELSELFTKIPGDLRAELERKRPNLKSSTVAPVDDGACGSCYQTITPQMKSALMMSHAVTCSACGALLFIH
jgi:predicted  nucleic acid-binding Zn-ribbon protein